jgi:hypothetical protein
MKYLELILKFYFSMDKTEDLINNSDKFKLRTERMKHLENSLPIKRSLKELKEHIKTLRTIEEKEDAALLYLMQEADEMGIGSEDEFFKTLEDVKINKEKVYTQSKK